MRVAIVVGNPKPQSRTLQLASAVVEHLVPPDTIVEVVDLAVHVDEIFSWPSERMTQLAETVASSDLVVFATPTYKATYTALLKAFLDRYPANGLAGVVAIPIATGGDLTHAMGADSHLVPLLLELGAMVPGRSLYFVTGQMEELDDIAAAAAAQYADSLGRAASLHAQLVPTTLEDREPVAVGKAER